MSLLTTRLSRVFEEHRGKILLTENFSGRSLTGGELIELSGRIAAALKAKGAGKGAFVPIILPRCIDYVAAEIGALRAGCGYAPLLPEYPQDRIDYIKNDCQAPVLIDEAFIREAMTYEPVTEDVETGEDDVSLLIYTSGSTGNPKGVMHTHRSFYESLEREQQMCCMKEDDKTLGLVSFSFAWSVAEIYDTLIVGAQIIILNTEERKDLKYVRNAIRENGITVMYINPNMLKRLDIHDSTLRVVKTAGERLSDFYTDEYQIVNIYGTSETYCALSFPIDKAYDNTPIGKAYLNTSVVLLDENGKEVPQGEEGEICITGHLAKGYLNLPEQTSKAFGKNPFTDDETSVLYHTGDMGRLLPDGSVLYVNRKDWMVKINGQRVETGEIEVRIVTDHPEVETAIVKAFENEFGLTYLAAYYKVKNGMSVTSGEIKDSLRQKMPDYMIPRFFVEVEAFPLNPNGKLDRKAIQPPMAASFKEEYVAPETEYEKILCAAFEKLLKCGQVGINDNFFSLGGDSLLAMTLQAECGIAALSSEMIFKGKTPKEIAARLEMAQAPEVSEKAALAEYPLSPFETGMYLEQKLNPESRMYNLISYYEVGGASAQQVKDAAEEIFRSHEAFHSVYREKDGKLIRMIVDEIPSVTIQHTDDIKAVRELSDALDKTYDLSGGIPVSAIIYTDEKSCVLALFYHHIMFDGGSDVLFGRELFARLTRNTPVIDSFDLSGASQEDDEAVYQKGFEKYRTLFADGVPVTELPLRAARPKVHPESDTNRFFAIDGDLLQDIKQSARQKSVTAFDMLLSAYSMTAAKYTASEDIVISVPVNTRNGKTHNTIGMFVNTALLRLKPVRSKMTDDYILEVKEAVSEYINENTCPYDRLVAAFAKDRDSSRSLLSDLGINYIPTQNAFEGNGITLRTSYRLQTSGKDINLVMQVREQGIDCYLQYSSELFDESVISNFIEQFLSTAEKLCADQSGTVRQALDLPAMQKKALNKFSVSEIADIPVKLLHKLFEQSAHENADRIALIAKDKTLTYSELNNSANIVAHNLIERNIRTGDSIVLLLPRESCFFSCMFGVNKAGAAFIPCDPQYPADRIRSIIEDSGASYIITTGDRLADYSSFNAIDVNYILSGNDTSDPCVEISGDDLAYMIYTSGSTGKPKGVMLRHIGICNYLMPHPANTHIHFLKNNISTYLSVTTVSFDMSFKEHTAALCNGKTLVFASEDEMNDPRALAQLMKKHGVDCINATPSRLQQYMEYEPFRNELAGCKLVMSGGEGYPISLRDAVRACSDKIKIVNTYGPTEITVSSNAADLTNADYVTIGRPLLNYSEYIVDRYGDIAPYGVTGELYVGGPGVALGYRNLPEKTAEAFVEFNGRRMYRTGDYAKFDKDGNVFISGRLDSQVKLRGLRIELSEIEELIAAQPHIKTAAVVIRKLGGQDNLCAYFTADTAINIDELRDELKKHLTHYMVPTAYMQMDEMPVTANGKTDKNRLPELTAAEKTITPPQSEMQQRIFDIAADVLGNSDFGIETELFAAGLTSLNSVGLCIKLSDAFGVNVQIRDLRDNDTIKKLEAFIIALADEGGEEFEILDEYAVTQTQEGIFFEMAAHPDSTIYNIPTLIKLDDSIDLPRLKQAIAAAVNAHPYLMTRMFINSDGSIRQKRTDRMFEESEITALRCGNVDELTDSLIRPFDIENEKLYRFSVIETDSGNYLFFDIHHIVFDGESKKILLRDITAAYNGETITPEKYSGYEAALTEKKLRSGAHYEASKKYYTELLEGVESDCVPYNDILCEDDKKDSGMLNTAGRENIPSVIRDYCVRNNVSENAFCTAVFGWILGKYSGREDDAVFTTVNNGRNDPRFRDSVSMFVRTYPVLCRLDVNSVSEYIRQTGRQLADSLQYDVYSFAEISHDLGIAADVLFVYQNTMADGNTFDFCGAKSENIPLTFDEEKAKIELLIYPDGNRFNYHVSYNADSYSESFIRSMLETYEIALSEFAEKENISEVQLVDEETESRLESVNHFEHDYEITDIVTLFRRRVEKSPDNIAVVYLDHRYTYREVDRITENIAAFLKSKGIGKNNAVSVMIPRCEYMPIAALGIHKAGAGYQPLDPTYPSERLEFMIKDADAKYLIADRSLMDKIPGYDGPVLYTDEIPDLPDAEKITENPDPGDLFIMLYTSGSTGVPKGVMLEHHNLCCFCEWYITTYQMDETSRASAYASYGFDCHMLDMYPVLISGGQLHIIDESIRLDLVEINKYFRENGITHTFMTTQVGRQYADLFPDAENPHHLSAAGEKLVPVAPPRGFRLYNGYGPTECTIFTHMYPVEKMYKRVPIGYPLFNMKQYIVDKNMNRLPFGMPGELVVAGHQVGRGYLNRPEQNAKVFIRNPFSDEPGYEHAYRTGDIARILSNGTTDFIGRNDGQVKIRGFRIELSEVEGVIRSFPGIKDATVQAFDEAGGGKFIAAYVVSDEPVDVAALGEFIKRDKPAYMVPAVTMQIDRIPLNQNQKVNRRALPKPELKAHTGSAADRPAAPLNVLEQGIKEIVSSVVGTTDFGITDLFVDLGLTSISSIRLAMLIYEKYNVQINVRGLVSGGSIQSVENDILGALLSQDKPGDEQPAQQTEKDQASMTCRLSFAQQGVYTECMADPDSVRYNIPFALTIPDGISAQQLADAVQKVIDAHPYILCRFASDSDNEIIQKPIPDCKIEIPVSDMTADEYDAYKKAFVRPFDLAKGPCLRTEIVRTDKLHLLVDMHHLISDGASMDLFFRQLCLALDGGEPEKESFCYYDFASQEKITQETEDFFAGQMTDVDEATQLIPDVFDKDIPHTQKFASVPTDISAVTSFAISNRITPAAVYLAACFLTFSRFLYEDTVSITTVSNGRSNVRVSNTMGMFVNTLPLVTTLNNQEKTADFIKRVAQTFSDTIEHENYPFARIASQYDFHPSVSYAYQIGVLSGYRTKYGNIESESLHSDDVKIPLSVFIDGTEDKADVLIAYDAAMYSEAMMNTVAACIENAVSGLMKNDTLSEISITNESQWKVLDGYNPQWNLDYDMNDTVLSAFKKVAAELPDKTAAVFKDKSYTYKELDEITDILAAKIYKLVSGITGKTDLAEEVVAIILPRNEQTMILPLAAAKAGVGYEPLDPSYPPERLNFMVNDADACVLIADDDLRNVVNEFEGTVVTVSELYNMENADVVPVAPSPSSLFIMLYTSGSTGAPKGCQIEHGNVVAFAYGTRPDFYRRDDRIAAYASFSFDVNMADVFCTYLNGGTVYLIPEEIRMNLDDLAAYFDEVGITALLLTTQVGVQFLQNYPKLKTLRRLVMGGEKLPAVNPSGLSYTIVNGYGPTENCCGVSQFPIKEWEPNIPIGKPTRTIHGYILDKTGHRLPAGAAGEYCVSGPQVSRGYLNRPDKTAEAYENCPFNEFRMYHTGDIVRYRQSGDVEFVGRKDGQVKIRGFRIETKEVEAVFREYDGIRDVTVQAYDYESGGKYLAAFVVSDSEVDINSLTEYVKSQKPAYMVPAVIMQIDKIPLTVNQKVDKKALPKPEQKKADYVAPKNKTEEDFCAVFGNILGIDRFSAEEDFFEAGGSSILAMKVVIAAEKAGYKIVYNDVFTYTTPSAMAQYVGAESEKSAEVKEGPAVDIASWTPPTVGTDGYDYTKIHELLRRNTMDAFRNGTCNTLEDVLFLGGTGYLGSHVLHELLVNHSGKVFCVIRPGKEQSGEQRLKATLKSYFGDDFASLFGSRITVIEGDATDSDTLSGFTAPSENMTVINCAASVKHFAKGNEIERINVESVRNLTSWCERNNARLVHISTGSIMGGRQNGLPPASFRFDEHILYAGQELESNQYIHSKFMAERHIYEEILNNGLKAKVCRVGNLAPRDEDGEFQLNYQTNNFMNTLKAFAALGVIGYDRLGAAVEFSAIDCLAKAILLLAKTPDDCVCFIPMNAHRPLYGDIISTLNDLGYRIDGAENTEFAEALNKALADEKKSAMVSSLIAYNNNGDIRSIGLESLNNTYTINLLARLGFTWAETGKTYIRRFLEKLEQKGFFGGIK